MTGQIEITVRDVRSHLVVEKQVVKNVVTDAMKMNALKLLLRGWDDSGAITRMQFGTGSLLEAATDVHLQSPVTPIKAVTVSYPTAASVTFTAYLLATEGNGFPIREAGLLTSEGVLAARRVFNKILKTNNYILEFRWTISC